MGETTFILKDANEKRIMSIHYTHFFESIRPALEEKPSTIEEFNDSYFQVNGGTNLYVDAPKAPPVSDIKRVIGIHGSDEEVLAHWKSTNCYERSNYQSFKAHEKTEDDIPELTRSLLEDMLEEDNSVTQDEWARVPESLQRKIRRNSIVHDGTIEVDLTKAQIRYISNNVFSIEHEGEYSVPGKWKIVEE